MRIPIFMYQNLTQELHQKIMEWPDEEPFNNSCLHKTFFGPSGRWIIENVLSTLNLTRYDEIAIITTSDETYVSICVSIPAFNHARISRVVTGNTKVVILIHEFGYVIPDLIERIRNWKEKGIIIIEDCAHLIGLKINGYTIGSFGDYAVFSLPKIIPASSGGMLKTAKNISLPSLNQDEMDRTNSGKESAKTYLSKIQYFNNARIEKSEYIKKYFEGTYPIFEPSKICIPFFIGILTELKDKIQKGIDWVEWGATLRKDLVYIPVNPLVDLNVYKETLKVIKQS
ncbi:MAG: DegT/DnrJ/EryC1/StrS family aminotransferase [Ignavibacteriales bacterium]